MLCAPHFIQQSASVNEPKSGVCRIDRGNLQRTEPQTEPTTTHTHLFRTIHTSSSESWVSFLIHRSSHHNKNSTKLPKIQFEKRTAAARCRTHVSGTVVCDCVPGGGRGPALNRGTVSG